MARNGSGTYSLYTPGNPVVTGTVISSTAFINTMNDIATALTQSVAADGQTPITANIPMNSHKITGLAAGTSSGDALSYGQSAASLASPSISAPAFSGTATGSLTNLALTTPTLTTPTITSGATADNLTVTNGVNVGNTSNASATILDWYEEGTFTPTLKFGGLSTGITYNANTGGSFTRIGNRVYVELRLKLSSKGSATGSAAIGGLPYAMASTGVAGECLGVCDYLSLSSLTGAVIGVVTSSSTNISLVQTGAAATASLTEANFTNSSDIYVSLQYRV